MHLVFLQKVLFNIKLSFTAMQDLWGPVLGEIEVEVSRAVFFTLFKKTALISLDENIATISAPSVMIADLLERRFYQLIKKALDKQTGLNTNLLFISKALPLEIKKTEESLMFPKEEKITVGHLPRVRSDYTFENLAVSSSNQLAFVSAKSVSQKPGGLYNPLFIHGPVGVGKTHLMQAIANDVYAKSPNKKILYITSEEFTNEVVEAIRSNSTSSMKRRFRNLDLFLIDDVQFLAGKGKIQEELFHTFNILVDNSSQIVLSSDRDPQDLKGIEKRLSSRFSGGLTVDIEPPEFELRCAIILIKAKRLNISLPMEGVKMIAQSLEDTRALEGALLKIVTEAKSLAVDVTTGFIEKVLGRREEKTGFRPEDIINNICTFYGVRPSQLKSPKRDASFVRPRQVAMYLLKKRLGLTLSEIGEILGGRDHTTIMHGVEKIEGLVENGVISSEDILGLKKTRGPVFVD